MCDCTEYYIWVTGTEVSFVKTNPFSFFFLRFAGRLSYIINNALLQSAKAIKTLFGILAKGLSTGKTFSCMQLKNPRILSSEKF